MTVYYVCIASWSRPNLDHSPVNYPLRLSLLLYNEIQKNSLSRIVVRHAKWVNNRSQKFVIFRVKETHYGYRKMVLVFSNVPFFFLYQVQRFIMKVLKVHATNDMWGEIHYT